MSMAVTLISTTPATRAEADQRPAPSRFIALLEFLIRHYSVAARAEWREDSF